MAIDNTLIEKNLNTIKDEIRILNTKKTKLENLLNGYTSILEIKENIPNDKGGYDVVKKTPNRRNLSTTHLTQERQLTYEDCNTKFTNRNK